MIEANKVEIQSSKFKLILLSLGAIGFTLTGFWILSLPESILPPEYSIPFLKNGIAIFCIIFFGLCAIIGFKKILNNKPTIIIDAKGIDIEKRFIHWADVTRTEVATNNRFDVFNTGMKFLVLFVKNPEQYIENEPSKFKRNSMLLTYRLHGSPICMPHAGLKINFDQLKNILNYHLSKYGNNSQVTQFTPPNLEESIDQSEPELNKTTSKKKFINWIALILIGLIGALSITQPDKFMQIKQALHDYSQSLSK